METTFGTEDFIKEELAFLRKHDFLLLLLLFGK